MAQKKGQTGNPNGRPKGTPNKVTADLREFVDELLHSNKRQIVKDMKRLEPQQRVAIFEKLLSYSLPKKQSISIEAQIAAEYAALENLVDKLPEEAVSAISEKIIKLSEMNKGKDYE
jgi:hypothetical protein